MAKDKKQERGDIQAVAQRAGGSERERWLCREPNGNAKHMKMGVYLVLNVKTKGS